MHVPSPPTHLFSLLRLKRQKHASHVSKTTKCKVLYSKDFPMIVNEEQLYLLSLTVSKR